MKNTKPVCKNCKSCKILSTRKVFCKRMEIAMDIEKNFCSIFTPKDK